MLEQLRVAGAGGPVDESEVIAGAMELGCVADDGLKPGFVGAKTVLQALAEPGISLVPIQTYSATLRLAVNHWEPA